MRQARFHIRLESNAAVQCMATVDPKQTFTFYYWCMNNHRTDPRTYVSNGALVQKGSHQDAAYI